MKLVVGLGNPGKKYHETRHNVGFAAVQLLAERQHLAWESAPRGIDALSVKWQSGGAVLAKPLTFMNLSGQAIGELVRYFKIDLADIFVVVDETQLPLGKLRARARGSAGGHNGLKSVIAHVGESFSRLRLGVGRGERERDLADHVLARFDKDETPEVERMVARASDASELFVTSGIAAVMNRYNGGDPATTE